MPIHHIRYLTTPLLLVLLLAWPAGAGAEFNSSSVNVPSGTVLFGHTANLNYDSYPYSQILYVSSSNGGLRYIYSNTTGTSFNVPVPDAQGAVAAAINMVTIKHGFLAYIKEGKLYTCTWQDVDGWGPSFATPQFLAEVGEGEKLTVNIETVFGANSTYLTVTNGSGQQVMVFWNQGDLDSAWRLNWSKTLGGEGAAPAARLDSQQRTHVAWFPQDLGGLFYALYTSSDSQPPQTRVCPTSQQGVKMGLDDRQQPWMAYPAIDGSLWQAFLYGQGYTISDDLSQPMINKSQAWPAGTTWRDYAAVAWEDGQGCLVVAGEDQISALRFERGGKTSQQTVVSGVKASKLTATWSAETRQIYLCFYDETSGEMRMAWGSLD